MTIDYDNWNHVEKTFHMRGFGTLKVRSELLPQHTGDNAKAVVLTFIPQRATSKMRKVVVTVNSAGEFEIEERPDGSRSELREPSYDGLGLA